MFKMTAFNNAIIFQKLALPRNCVKDVIRRKKILWIMILEPIFKGANYTCVVVETD